MLEPSVAGVLQRIGCLNELPTDLRRGFLLFVCSGCVVLGCLYEAPNRLASGVSFVCVCGCCGVGCLNETPNRLASGVSGCRVGGPRRKSIDDQPLNSRLLTLNLKRVLVLKRNKRAV